MKKLFVVLLSLFSVIISSFLPMKKKDIGYEDNACFFEYSSIYYVKPCSNGKYCNIFGDYLGICQDIPPTFTLLGHGSQCNSNDECQEGLYCSGTCKLYPDTTCENKKSPLKRVGGWECVNTDYKDYCQYVDDTTSVNQSPDYFQVCGIIDFTTTSRGTNGEDGYTYSKKSIKSSYIGVEDTGKFVLNPLACKSGYAIPHYYTTSGGSHSNPYKGTDFYNQEELMCVEVEDYEYKYDYDTDSEFCLVKYDGGKIYKPSQCEKNLLTKLELFKKYIEVFTEDKQKECAKEENYNEPRTCNDNEIRKWYFLYEHPEYYIEYYDKDLKYNDVLIFLIQQKYPSYQKGAFLNINFIIYLLFFLLSL